MTALRRPEIVVEHLAKSFGGKPVLVDVDLTIGHGELVAIVGGSGCGKTVLLKHITGHFAPDAGRVLVADHDAVAASEAAGEKREEEEAPLVDLALLDERSLDRIRARWGVVFQRNALLTGNVLHNLSMMPRELRGWTPEEILPRARAALAAVGLDPDLVLGRDREELSGGMAKRVAIARALVMEPTVLVYDEPTSGLDPEMCVQIHELIRSTHAGRPAKPAARRTSIVVTHDTGLLHRLEPRVVMLHAGRVRFDGTYAAFVASDDPHIAPYLGEMAGLQQRNHD
jgi:phospholipid/cholesterol/gamma-HCH transport system ATP-binding protein